MGTFPYGRETKEQTMRIAIIGNSGAGKSTLARALRERFRLAHLDLDTIVWEPGQIAVRRKGDAMRGDLVRFLGTHDDWVVEGCYAELVALTLARRPTLVWLNLGLNVCLENNRKRPWEPHKYASKAEQDKMLAPLLDWVSGYYARDDDWSLQAHARLFEQYEDSKIECGSRVDLPALLDELAGAG
jgi:adenylate kinase family enzyme